jgi:hypothetical protein
MERALDGPPAPAPDIAHPRKENEKGVERIYRVSTRDMISSMIYHDIDDDTQFVSGVVDVMDSYGLDRSRRLSGLYRLSQPAGR